MQYFFWWILFHNHNTPHISPQTTCIIPYAKCHPKLASGSHHSSTKPLIPGFPIRSSSSSSQAPPAVDCFAGPPIASTLKSFTRVKNTKKNCIKHQNRIKDFLPKTGCVRMFILTENQFNSFFHWLIHIYIRIKFKVW